MKKRRFKVLKNWIISLSIAICCFLYAIVVRRTGSGTGFYIIWILLGLLSIIWRIMKDSGFFGKLPRLLKRLFCLGVILGVGTLVLTWVLIFSSFFAKPEAGLDYIIVLGAQVRTTGPSIVLRYRLDTAYDYLQENPAAKCIVSGGQGYNEPEPEGVAMKRYLVEKGIKAERIIVEDASVNTMENVKNSSEYLNKENDKVGIVTNNFHVFRGVALAKKAGFKHVRGIAAPSNHIYLPNNALRESLGIVKDFLVGNL